MKLGERWKAFRSYQRLNGFSLSASWKFFGNEISPLFFPFLTIRSESHEVVVEHLTEMFVSSSYSKRDSTRLKYDFYPDSIDIFFFFFSFLEISLVIEKNTGLNTWYKGELERER